MLIRLKKGEKEEERVEKKRTCAIVYIKTLTNRSVKNVFHPPAVL